MLKPVETANITMSKTANINAGTITERVGEVDLNKHTSKH